MSWFHTMLRPEIEQLRAYHPVNAPEGAIRLDANESPYGLSPEARALLTRELAKVDLHRYPDVRATALRRAIADRNDADPDQIVIGCGSDEVIALTVATLSGPGAPPGQPAFAFPDPSFVMFRISALAAGGVPLPLPLDDSWDLDVAATERALSEHRPRVVFLPSPNNPTGNRFSDDRIGAVVEAARDHALVLLDEAYAPFADASYAWLRKAHPHVGQLQTLSKIGLAGARVGWAILPPEMAVYVDRVRQPYNLNALSQRAAELAFGELREEFDAAIGRIRLERSRLRDALSSLPGVRAHPSEANFLWTEVDRGAETVHRELLARKIVVRSFHASKGRLTNHVRITVGTPQENDLLVSALRAFVA